MTEQKTCRLCGVTAPVDAFYRMPSASDGRDSRCKECAKEQVRRNRRERSDQYREYERGRASLPHRVEARRTYAKTEKGAEAFNRARARYRERYPDRYKATNKVNNALRDGVIEKDACFFCGGTDDLAAHHHDYSKPLDVTWLCRSCHIKHHKLERMARS